MTETLRGLQSVRPEEERRFAHDVLVDELPAAGIQILLHAPGGITFDLSDRVDLGSIGEIEEGIEEDLTQFTHGDLGLEIRDPDGAVERLLTADPLAPGFTVELLRETKRRGRVVWERLFGGVLDQPWSVKINVKEQTVSLRAFSYSKLLEQTSAETVCRQITGRTGTVGAGSAAVTVSDATGMLAGDKFTLTSATSEEERTILSIAGAVITADSVFANAYTAATLTVTTPWHRSASLAYLAGALFEAAGIDDYSVILSDADTEHFPSPAHTGTIATTANQDLLTLTVHAGRLLATRLVIIAAVAFDTADARTEWTQLLPGERYKADWTPYHPSEPAALLATTTYTPREDDKDIGSTRAAGAGSNGKARPCWDFSNSWVMGGATFSWDINSGNSRLWMNGVNKGQIEATIAYSAIFLEYDPVNFRVWYSRCRSTGSLRMSYIANPAAPGTLVDLSTTEAGKMRMIRPLSLMAVHLHTDNITPTNRIAIWTLAGAKLRELTLPSTEIEIWTMRAIEDKVACLYRLAGEWRCIIWQYPTWTVESDRSLGGPASGEAFLTTFDDPEGGARQFFAFAGSTVWASVIAPWYAGIVPLADFSDQSCAAAMADLATVAGTQFIVTPERIGEFRNRLFIDRERDIPILSIDRPLTLTRQPIWEGYRTRVKVTFTDSSGESAEIVRGATGDSSRSLDVETQLIQVEGQAEWLADRLASFFSKQRAGAEAEVMETGPVHAGDRIYIAGDPYLVLESNHDPAGRRHEFSLVAI